MAVSADKKLARKFYYVCLGVCVLLFIGYMILNYLHITITEINPYPCSFYSTFGLYCPGCGGTRAVDCLLHGHFIRSFLYHPAVPYAAFYFGCYILSHSLNILTRGKCKAMPFRPIYFYIMIAIIILQCVIKNALVIFAGIHVI